MVIEIEIEFHENEIPPRCRKPRPIGHKEKVKVRIKEATASEAPVAFFVHSLKERPMEVRLFKSQLYKEARISFYNGKCAEEYAFEAIPWETVFRKYPNYGEYTTKAEYIAYLKLTSREYLIVDGRVFHRCYEPFYRITTFGYYGCGTAIFPEFSDKSRKEVFGYSALDKDQAISDAIEIARNRGDEKDIDSIRRMPHGPIDVIMPSACKRKFKRQI